MRLRHIIIFIVAILIGMIGFLCFRPVYPIAPALLSHVTAKGGWLGACPPKNEMEAEEQKGQKLALSPELNQRLNQQFPVGSDESNLIATLTQQGLNVWKKYPCDNDQSIHVATFSQKGGGLLLFPLDAQIYWKVDPANKIIWTKGFVSYTGL